LVNVDSEDWEVFINRYSKERYQEHYSEWIHLEKGEITIREWRPCQYFHQLNMALKASHSVLNYAMFLAIMNKNLPSRELLVLDEAHLLETELVRFRGISISEKKWRKYIPDLKIENHGYDIREWVKHCGEDKDIIRVYNSRKNGPECLIIHFVCGDKTCFNITVYFCKFVI
jgi:Rad3-related DNA helicase